MPSFETLRFGELAYRDEDIIRLPEGLLGMPDLRRWLILDMGDDVPLKWFQSLDRADFGFPVTQPFFFADEYTPPVGESHRRALEVTDDENLTTLIITTIHPGGERVTGNLLAPLVIDTETRRGVQLTLDDGAYELRQEIDYLKFGLAVQCESAENDSTPTGAVEAEAKSREENLEPAGV